MTTRAAFVDFFEDVRSATRWKARDFLKSDIDVEKYADLSLVDEGAR